MSSVAAKSDVTTETAGRIDHALCRQWRMIERVDVRPVRTGAGCEVSIALNSAAMRARAEQQGLADSSGAAVAADPRAQAAFAACIEKVNRRLAAHEMIVGWSILA